MGAEIGATCSLFAYDDQTAKYLKATGREALADLADKNAEFLRNDAEVDADPERFYDQIVEINLSDLTPHLVGPHTPDLDRPISELAADAAREGYPTHISAALVGSCTNSSYEDIGRAANIARQAKAKGMTVKTPLMVTPGSEQVRATIERDGLLADLEAIGATVLANACGPCIGQWQRDDMPEGKNTIVTTFNRNFPARNDGNKDTLSFIGSPETVVGMALTGELDDSFTREFEPPVADDLPSHGFDRGESGFIAPAADPSTVEVIVKPGSDRLELLTPFAAWDGNDITGMRVLLKAQGKCTTDHVSPAGKWLKYRGHLTNISQNMFLGAINSFAPEQPGMSKEMPLPDLAKKFKSEGVQWIAIGDENYGEGSSREHAAMEPRYMGARVVLARSFARIAEANLKKQGLLPLTFADAADYDKIREDDVVDVIGVTMIAPGSQLFVVLHHADGSMDEFAANHTMSDEQIEWFKAGSALNLLASKQ
jgi:aconitate hydratase